MLLFSLDKKNSPEKLIRVPDVKIDLHNERLNDLNVVCFH